MGYAQTLARPNKTKVTNAIIKQLKNAKTGRKHQVLKSMVCLPSTNALDVTKALEKGLIDTNTKLIAIEHKPNQFLHQIKTKLESLGFTEEKGNLFFILKDICDITGHDLNRAKKHFGIDSIDCWYLDTCSCVTSRFRKFLKNVVRKYSNDQSLICTNIVGAHDTSSDSAVNRARKKCIEKSFNLLISTGHIVPSNRNAQAVTDCLSKLLDMQCILTVNYKEEPEPHMYGERGSGGKPMLLNMFQSKAIGSTNNSGKDIDAIQCLGYPRSAKKSF